ncbi:hypothetical protein [Arsenicicoccus dermatophilus]|uniref:hypothetical protein n=1 Tax=Arsenicicoccus dermatophilus TaxID=1076331 RepID=UPI003916F262
MRAPHPDGGAPVPGGHLRRARRRAPWWLGAGVLVLLTALWGHLNPTDSRLVHELLDHPIVHGAAGYALLGWGLRSLVTDAQRRLVVTILVAAVGATVLGLVGMLAQIGVHPDRDERVLPAPVEGVAEPYEADVVTDGDPVSPRMTVAVQHRALDLAARRWDVACVSTEYDPLADARWQAPGTLVLRLTSGRQVTVGVDPATGQPREPVRLGRRCGGPAGS